MDDNRIEIVARLDTSRAAVVKIEADLSKITDQLNKDQALKIIANLDLNKTTQRINSQLATINKNLNLDLGGLNINTSEVSTEVNSVVGAVQKALGSATNIKLQVDSAPINEFVDRLRDVGVGSKIIDQLKNKLESLDVVITKIVPQFTQLKGGEQQLTSFSITGLDKVGNTIEYIEKFNAETGDFEKSSTKMISNLVKIQQENKKIEDSAKAAQLAYNDFLKLKGQADVYSKQYAGEDGLKTQLTDIQKLIGEFDNTQPLEKQREGIINIDNALKLLKVDIENIKKSSMPVITKGVSDFYPNIAKGTSTQETIFNAKNQLNELFAQTAGMEENTANRVKRAVEDTTGVLQTFFVQVERGDKSIETLTYALNEQGNAYEYLGKTIREADNSTDFRRKGLDVQKQIQASNLEKFIAQVEKSGVATDNLKERIANLKNQIEKIDDTNGMNAFLDDLDIAKAKFQALNNISKKENFAVSLSNKIKKLSADMREFAINNQRAIESTKQMSDGTTFQQKWASLSSQMARGSALNANEVKHLSEEFRIFGKEASTAGLKGASAFDKFKKSFTTISSYITASMVFNFAKQQIRQLVQEVVSIDTAMTELRKVTEATESEFEAFAVSAAKTGKQLGASISDVINATSTFSRAGYNLPDAEELGRIATLYKNVGDGIGIDTASESIISVMKAFNIEAENSIGIIDRINEVSNKAAIDSGGLGLALQRVASAMNAANNSLDETIALTTSANEVVQNPEMVAQGWRTVALRIRGAKSELEDAGLETEGMVESTAKLRDLIKQISGVDIMLDKNTFKSTYQIVDELGRVWDNISDINQASLLEAIAGRFYLNVQKCA